jgi:hypothetical protein
LIPTEPHLPESALRSILLRSTDRSTNDSAQSRNNSLNRKRAGLTAENLLGSELNLRLEQSDFSSSALKIAVIDDKEAMYQYRDAVYGYGSKNLPAVLLAATLATRC